MMKELKNKVKKELDTIAEKGLTSSNLETTYKLVDIYKDIVDYWILVDNATNPRQIIAEQDFDSINIFDKIKYQKIQDYANS